MYKMKLRLNNVYKCHKAIQVYIQDATVDNLTLLEVLNSSFH